MNPASASLPTAPRQMVNDVSRTPAPQPAAADGLPAAPNIVANIPVHNQAAPAPVNEDAELDKIMRDVGQEMKNEDKKPAKHGFLNFGHKPKTEANFSAQAIRQQPRPAPMPAAPAAAQAAPDPAPPAAPSPIVPQPQAAAAAVKPKSQSSVPVFVIFVVFLVTGFLVAAAIAAYRQT